MKHSLKIVAAVIILLGFILGTGIYSMLTLKETSDKLQTHIIKIEDSAKTGKWDDAKTLLSAIEEDWSSTEKSWAILIDHAEIDNIDTAISRMSKYVEEKDSALALGEAAALKQFIKHIPDKETFKFKNIF